VSDVFGPLSREAPIVDFRSFEAVAEGAINIRKRHALFVAGIVHKCGTFGGILESPRAFRWNVPRDEKTGMMHDTTWDAPSATGDLSYPHRADVDSQGVFMFTFSMWSRGCAHHRMVIGSDAACNLAFGMFL